MRFLFFFSHAGGFGLVFKFVNWILPKCCMLFSQFQSNLRVTNIDYWERYTGGKPWAGECCAGTFIMRLRTAAGSKKTNNCFWNVAEVKAGVNRGQQGSTGTVLCYRWVGWSVSLFGQTDEYCQHFEQLRHVQGFVKCYRSDWITHNSFSHRYLDEKLWCGDAPIWCLLLAWYWHRWISWGKEDFF